MPNAIEIINISEQEMADYISRAFSANSVKRMLTEADTLHRSETLFQKFGNILQAYACTTGDLSNETIDSLAKDLHEHKDILQQPYDQNTRLEAEQIYFGKYVMPKIIENYAKKMKIDQPLSLSDSCKILAAVETSNKNNRFRTHSFNGALLTEIKKNGLDINKEMFIEEFNVLSSANMMQPYQRGNLLFCELSKASFGYALRAPERLVMSLSRYGSEQKKDQSTNEFLTQELRDNLSENQNLSDTDKQKNFAAGKKIIDFYFGEHNKSAIAFVKDKIPYTPVTSEKYEQMLGSQLSSVIFSMRLTSFLDKNNDLSMKNEYEKATKAFKANKDVSKLFDFVGKFNVKYPENNILKRATEMFMVKSMTKFGLNNFTYDGYADGYKIDGGKMSKDQFALAEFENPIDVYVLHNKQQKIDNKLAKLRKRMAGVADKIAEATGTEKVVQKFTDGKKIADVEISTKKKLFEKKISDRLFGKVKE